MNPGTRDRLLLIGYVALIIGLAFAIDFVIKTAARW